MTACPFCEPTRDRVFYEDSLVLALWDGFPVSPGHALGSARFTYYGEVQFADWEGDEPVTIRWRLTQSLPDRLKHSFKVGEV